MARGRHPRKYAQAGGRAVAAAMAAQQNGFKFGKFGLLENPVGHYVSLPWQGRELLGEVIAVRRDPFDGRFILTVRHFCGDPWPVEPIAAAVRVLRQCREDCAND